MLHTSVSYTFTFTLDKSNTSTPITTRFELAQGPGHAQRLTQWRLEWNPTPPRFILVEEGYLHKNSESMPSSCSAVPDSDKGYATITIEPTAPAQAPQPKLELSRPIARGYGSWVREKPHTSEWGIKLCEVNCKELFDNFQKSEASRLEMSVTVQIGENERASHDATVRCMEEHRVMSEKIDSLQKQYRETRLRQHAHDVRFLFSPSGRTLFANSKTLCSRSSYYQDVLNSGFIESQKITSSKCNKHEHEHANSTPCKEEWHTLHIDEDDPDTFETYATALTWLSTNLINFNVEDPFRTLSTAEAIYRLADQLCLDDLSALALDALHASLTPANAVTALFSTLSRDFTAIRQLCVGYCVKNWCSAIFDEVKGFIAQGDGLEIGALEAMDVMAALSARLFESPRRTPTEDY
ncbi:BQ5605_C047g12315 [Microbotryum silenes-dioicae]|uniref:BQ5605_C047g12315 protein n=1 Tax=Microbotryum silenes-dioicae TaxID=796604 RepID=A0A2X0PI66_9BASI|nr:BQ5605_C047g12315 [Microbotryum silenes-dioicae]